MKTEVVSLASISTWRPEPTPYVDLEHYDWLESDIKKNGVLVPIVIDTDGALYEGLLRVTIAKRLGIDGVKAYVCEPIDLDVVQALERMHDQTLELGHFRVPLPPRVQQMNQMLRPLISAGSRRGTNPEKMALPPRQPEYYRQMIFRGIGGKHFKGGITLVNNASTFYGWLNNPKSSRHQQAVDNREVVEQGITLISSVVNMIRRSERDFFLGDIVEREDQLHAIGSAATKIQGIARGFYKLGKLNEDLGRDELGHLIKQLETGRREVSRFLTRLKRHYQQLEENEK